MAAEKSAMRTFLRQMYFGHSVKARVFRYALIAFDLDHNRLFHCFVRARPGAPSS